ncbi:MAG TPA: PAS domain S-box protein [Labilithrix sp.]|nr:PAS domain S-box protein [Labilithrix sp.]
MASDPANDRARSAARRRSHSLAKTGRIFRDDLGEDASRSLASVLEASGLGYWRHELASDRLECSPLCKANLGLDADADVSSFERLLTYIHPEDRSSLQGAVGRAVATGTGFDIEYRVGDDSGEPRWVVVRARVFPQPDGDVVMAGVISDLTAQKRAEAEREKLVAELKAERARLRTLIDHIPAEVVMTDATGRIELVNREASFFNARPSVTRMTDLYSRWQVFDKEGRALSARQRPFMRALAGETVSLENIRYIDNVSGSEGWAHVSCAPIRDDAGAITGVVFIAFDTSREKRTEQALRTSEGRLRQLFESPIIGIYHANIDGHITGANDTFLTMLGYSRHDLREGSLDWRAISSPGSDDADIDSTRELIATGSLGHREREYVRKDGTRVPVVTGSKLLEGSRNEIITFVLDNSERKRAETAQRRQEEFERQLIGIVSHDLRTPLSAITLATGMLIGSADLDEGTQRNVARIQRAADRATRLIHDLLDFTRARLGTGIPIEPRPVELCTLVRNLVDELRVAHPARRIDLNAPSELTGSFDADRIVQVCTNILENALKYSPSGSPVVVTLRATEEEAVLTVHNEGAPIPAELLPLIFEPLQRGERQMSDSASRSVGLGLYIVKHLVERHGGCVAIRSEHEGTEVRVRLPRSVSLVD